MKRKITLLLFAATAALRMNSQVVLQDGFTSAWNPATLGWAIVNNSSPVGTTSVFQGNGASVFPAYDGAANDYVGMNFNSVASQGGISTWLITPALTIYNGAVLQFATRKINLATTFPDRLQVRMSPTNVATVPSGTTSVGTFTTLMLDINPNLLNVSASAVNNGSVAGYPNSWTVYTLQVSGVTGTVTGRFAFRYFVNDGGQNGANSDIIGIDAVKYTLPCGTSVESYTSCAGVAAVLNATGGLSSTTYSWSNGGTSFSTAVTPSVTSPGSTQVFTLFPSVGGSVSCGIAQTATITIGAQLSMAIISSSSVLCSGGTVTLSALSAATNYSWSNGATTPVITVTPGASSIYTVVGISGNFPVVCFGTNSISITVNPSPVLAVSLTPSVLCAGVGSVTINASGANTYFYLGSSANPKSTSTPTAPGAYSFSISGTSNGCVSLGQVTLSVEANPTVTIFANKVSACINQVVTLTASGADTYVWSGQINSTSNPITYSATSVGTKVFNAIGTSSLGCTSASVAKTVIVSLCTGIENELGNNTESSIFPNPFTNELNISGLNGRIEIYNVLGQVILKTKVNEVERINTSELIKGAYILKAFNVDGQELKTIKLLKN